MIDELKASAGKAHTAHLEVEKADIPDSTLEAMWQGVKATVTDPKTALATTFLPGVGNFIAGAWATWKLGKEQDEVLERFNLTIDAFWSRVRQVIGSAIWDHFRQAEESGYTFPEPLPLLREKFDRLSDLEIRIGDEEEDSPSLLVAAQEVALEHPDLATAHLLLAQAYFFTEDYHNADIAAYRSQELDLENAEAHQHYLSQWEESSD